LKARFVKNSEPVDASGLTLADRGDQLSFESAAGGGYGDPLERDIAEVERDIRYDYVSIERAALDYGVVIDSATLKVDETATKTLRSKA